MAVVVLFRLAIALAPPAGAAATRAVKWAEGPGVAQVDHLPKWLLDRLHDPGEADADLTDAVAAWSGTVSDVATFPEPFELRKWQIEFSRSSGNVLGDDVAVITFHVLKLVAGNPDATWVTADFNAVQNALLSWWAAIKEWFPNETILDRIKVYKAGPEIEKGGAPVWDDTAPTVPGTSTAEAMPPQVALSVTERAGEKLHWGRFYLPAPATGGTQGSSTTGNGRPSTLFLTDVADATDALYEACKAASVPIVVYRAPLPERQKKDGTTLPARDGSAWTVDTIQIDDVFDVIRSRRWDTPLVRLQRGIA